jgi:hypothetical protein
LHAHWRSEDVLGYGTLNPSVRADRLLYLFVLSLFMA